ncbi:MAG: hypothetical protein V7K85_28660 [Nostoc sp.]
MVTKFMAIAIGQFSKKTERCLRWSLSEVVRALVLSVAEVASRREVRATPTPFLLDSSCSEVERSPFLLDSWCSKVERSLFLLDSWCSEVE